MMRVVDVRYWLTVEFHCFTDIFNSGDIMSYDMAFTCKYAPVALVCVPASVKQV